MTVYLDIIFIENIIMNYIILYATGIVYKTKSKPTLIFLSSLLGAFYTVLNYLQISNIFSSIFLKIILSICMVYIAFNPKNIKVLFKEILVFYMSSFLFGGVTFFLLYFIKPQELLMKNGIYIGTYPLKIVMLGAIIGLIILVSIVKFLKGRISRKELFCNLIIEIDKKSTRVKAMIDTGNLLIEPITKASVIIVEKNSLIDVIPMKILTNLKSILEGKYELDLEEYETKLRAIPFTSLGKENGLLLGIKPDKVVVLTEDGQIQIENVVIGIYNNYLSENGAYSALIGINVFERSKENESIVYAKK